MKDKELLNNELLVLQNKLKGQVVFRGNPVASGLPAFTKTTQRGRQFVTTIITQAEFTTAGKDPTNKSYAIPPLSPELAATAANNMASWMPEAEWELLVDAVLDGEPPPDGVDARTVEYMQSLQRRALHGFIRNVDAARETYAARAKGNVSVTHEVPEGDDSTESAIGGSAEGDSDTSSNSLLQAIWEHDHIPNW